MRRVEWLLCYLAILSPFLFLSWLPIFSRGFRPPAAFEITDAVLCAGIDKDRKPVQPTSVFPPDTRNVYCWFRWKNSRPGVRLLCRWYFLDQDINILDVPVTLTRIADQGAVSLEMPEDRALPPGAYEVEFELEGRVVKSVPFVIEKPASQTESYLDAAPPANSTAGTATPAL